MNYKIMVKVPNRIFKIRNRPVRSPFQITANEKEYKSIISSIKFYGLSEKDYKVEIIKEKYVNEIKDFSNISSSELENKIEQKEVIETKNIVLDKFPQKEKIIHTPLEKISKKEILEIVISAEEFSPIQNEIFNKPEEKVEQIINIGEDGVEVKIEELSIKATSLLEKFLNSNF
jgi:hypothetical protein